MTTQPAGPGPQPAAAATSVFVLSVPGLPGPGTGKILFQELLGITSEISALPAAATPVPASGGGVQHTRPPGATAPPKVTLKRGLDADPSLWRWHQLALEGQPGARRSASLSMFSAADLASGKPPVSTWALENAWCSKVDVGGAAAGAGAVSETVEIVCDRITRTTP